MTFKSSVAVTSAVWKALQEPEPAQRYADKVKAWSEQIAEAGWAYSNDIEDLPTYMDGRLDMLHDVRFTKVIDVFGLPLRNVYKKPDLKPSDDLGYPALAAADFAVLLIQLERFGLLMTPGPLVRALRPTLLRKPFVTCEERLVIHYEALQHRMAPIAMHVPRAVEFNGLREGSFKTAAGYKIRFDADESGNPMWLTSTAPKYRRKHSEAY